MNWKLLTLPLLAVLLLGFGATACGSDSDGGGDTLTLEEFLQEVEQLDTTFNTRGDELDAEFSDAIENVETEEEAIDLGRELFNDLATSLQEFVDGLADLNAPDEAQQIQDDAVSAGRRALEEFDKIIDDLADVETEAEFGAISEAPELDAAFNDFSIVCTQAQTLADENNIDVTFSCNDE